MRPSACASLAASLLVFVAASGPLNAQSDVLTPARVAAVRTVSAAIASPDGTRIAYTVSVPRQPLAEDDGPPWTELHLIAADGRSRPLITGKVSVGGALWTPDGKGLSFVTRRADDTAPALYVLPIDGGEAQRVLRFETGIGAYAWSPDGARVAFTAVAPPPKDRADLERKGFTQDVFEEDDPSRRVYVAALDGSSAPRLLDLPGHASAVEWSPAGNRLAVALAPTPLVDDDLMARRVHVVDPDTGRVVANLNNPGKLGAFAWSPDGRYLAMVSGEDINDPAAGRLLVAPADGGPLVDLLPGYLGHVGAIAWTDPNTIRYVGNEGVETTLAAVRRDGTGRVTVVPAGARVMSQFTTSRDGAVTAFVADSPQHPSEAFRMMPGAPSAVRLTDSNPWLGAVRLARQETVRYKARDGLELEGLLIRPLDEQQGRRYPLILTVHGGPEAHDRNGWLTNYSMPGHVAAARGFAVFYPNYRGSTGRGVAFSKLGQKDPTRARWASPAARTADTPRPGAPPTTRTGSPRRWRS